MQYFKSISRKQPQSTPPKVRTDLITIVGESIIDGIDEKGVTARIGGVTASAEEREAAMNRWRAVHGRGLIL